MSAPQRLLRRAGLALAGCALFLLPAGGSEKGADEAAGGGAKTPNEAADGVAPEQPAANLASSHDLDAALAAKVQAALDEGRAYLLTQQGEKGGFGDKSIKLPENVSYTAMSVTGLVAATPRTQVGKDAHILAGLRFLKGFAQPNGAIVDDPRITNYATGVSVSAFAAARVPEFAKIQAAGAAYLEGSQIHGDTSDLSYGGFPYKQHKGQSADASNASIATSALEDNGLPEDSPVRKRIETFVGKIQNNAETNTAERRIVIDGEERVVVSGVDGGGVYRPDESKAGMVKRADGKWELRSYGSMTYAVLKLLLFSGIDADDARVKAVVRWISDNWTVDRNPGFEAADDPAKAGQQGYFYYLYTLSRALSAYERSTDKPLTVTDAEGRAHAWRAEVARALLARQAEDGSWRNDVAERWDEGSQTLATAFALQTLGFVTGRLP